VAKNYEKSKSCTLKSSKTPPEVNPGMPEGGQSGFRVIF